MEKQGKPTLFQRHEKEIRSMFKEMEAKQKQLEEATQPKLTTQFQVLEWVIWFIGGLNWFISSALTVRYITDYSNNKYSMYSLQELSWNFQNDVSTIHTIIFCHTLAHSIIAFGLFISLSFRATMYMKIFLVAHLLNLIIFWLVPSPCCDQVGAVLRCMNTEPGTYAILMTPIFIFGFLFSCQLSNRMKKAEAPLQFECLSPYAQHI